MGDWIIVAMSWSHFPPDAAQRFISIFNDPTTHTLTRGSAVYGFNNSVSDDEGNLIPEYEEPALSICKAALQDESPYVRWLAIGLATRLGGFEEEIVRLTKDESVVGGGYSFTVASRAIEALEDAEHDGSSEPGDL